MLDELLELPEDEVEDEDKDEDEEEEGDVSQDEVEDAEEEEGVGVVEFELPARYNENAPFRRSYCSTTTFSAPCSPSLSQESTASTASSGSCNGNNKTPRLNNPYLIRRSLFAEQRSSLDHDVESEHVSSFHQYDREPQRIQESLLPPLPESAPKLREETVQSLSEQQLAVIELARPPTASSSDNSNKDNSITDEEVAQHQKEYVRQQPQLQQGYMVRVTAAAGTGKTTTLLHLAIRCLDLGHTNVTYVTFSRASAADAKNECWT
eukprot:CCRYP_015421-RG/>CCRYP_015421-RG protein AED:0.50 eAED:0.50 QI:0/0/0/0.5/1/1/2/0/264